MLLLFIYLYRNLFNLYYMNQSQPVALPAVAIIALALIIFKIVIFKRATGRKTVSRWLFFNQKSIINSSKPQSRRYKRIENTLSIFLFISLLTLLILFSLN